MKTRGTRSAFTLAELLIVIVIIGILMALLLPAILKGTVRSKVAVTRAKMSGIAMAIDAFQRDFGVYPPTVSAYNPASGKFDGDAYCDPENVLSKPGEFAYNEALVQCLCNRYTKGAGDLLDTVGHPLRLSIRNLNANGVFSEKILGNAPVTTSAPYLDVKASDLVDKDNDGFPELVDAWGNPFIYIPKDDYFQPDGTTYNAGAAIWTDVNINGVVDLNAGEFEHYQRFKFQMISLGPDNKTPWLPPLGTDILPYVLPYPYLFPYEYIDVALPPGYLIQHYVPSATIQPWRIGTDDDLAAADKNRALGFTGDDINNWGQ